MPWATYCLFYPEAQGDDVIIKTGSNYGQDQ